MSDTSRPLVAPFRGVRFADAGRLSSLIAPPYDVISPEERAALAARDPDNVVRYILPDGDDRYAEALRVLDDWLARGVLVEDDEPGVTVLRQRFLTPDGVSHDRTGVIAAVAVEPFDAGRVKPHERTHSGPKEDRLALLRASAFMFEALLMCAPDSGGELRRLVAEAQEAEPLATAELSGIDLTLWRVTGAAAEVITAVAGREPLYMADGHHRYETAVRYREEHAAAGRVPALLVPFDDPGLIVLPTHRVIVGKPVDSARVEAGLRDRFQVKELSGDANYVEELAAIRRRGTACVIVLPGSRALALLLRGGSARLDDFATGLDPAVAALDVTRVDGFVVKQLVAAGGKDARVTYSADPDVVIDAVRLGNAAAGVLLNPTAVADVVAVADAGAAMPQKSTYFFPKVPSGLVGIGYGR